MKNIITSILAALTLTIAAAQTLDDVEAFTMVLAMDLNGVYGCPSYAQEAVTERNGACYELPNTSIDTHRSLLDMAFLKYGDVTSLTPWSTYEEAYVRGYKVQKTGDFLIILMPNLSRGSTAVITTFD